jgi:hypothetical protein
MQRNPQLRGPAVWVVEDEREGRKRKGSSAAMRPIRDSCRQQPAGVYTVQWHCDYDNIEGKVGAMHVRLFLPFWATPSGRDPDGRRNINGFWAETNQIC